MKSYLVKIRTVDGIITKKHKSDRTCYGDIMNHIQSRLPDGHNVISIKLVIPKAVKHSL